MLPMQSLPSIRFAGQKPVNLSRKLIKKFPLTSSRLCSSETHILNTVSRDFQVFGKDEVASSVESSQAVVAAIPHFLPYSPISLLCGALDCFKCYTGLPWWATIAGATLSTRLLLIPVVIYTMRNGANMARMKPEMEMVQARFQSEQRSDPQAKARFQRDMQALMAKHNANPAKMLAAPLIQAPIFISFFLCTRRLAEWEPSLQNEAFLWVPSVANADPYYILPAISSCTMVAIALVGGETGNEDQDSNIQKFRKTMLVAAVCVAPLTYWMPSATFCYWITSNCFSCVQVPLMKLPSVKHSLGIGTALTSSEAHNAVKFATPGTTQVAIPGKATQANQIYKHPGSFSRSPRGNSARRVFPQ